MNLGVKTALFLAPPLPSFVNLDQHLVEPHFHLLNRDNENDRDRVKGTK